ncbi:hypothetical protein SUGI_0136480 [Cryptomeria japonica]|nr:hypothetical protein SUGI_0136480 [Cryptomeria japonica]
MTRLTVTKFRFGWSWMRPDMDLHLTKREKSLGLLCCLLFFFVLLSNNPLFEPLISNVFTFQGKLNNHNTDELTLALSRASMPNRTVIITTVNKAWMEPGGMFDLFMKSFQIGKGTTPFLKNLLVVAQDERAFNACTQIHPHCYRLKTPGVDFSGESAYMRGNYVKMTMSKVLLLTNVLRRGYHFLFSDSDILWFRNPFQMFSTDVDFEMSADIYLGNPYEMRNLINTGFMFVRSNNRTVTMMEIWKNAGKSRPNRNDQDVWYDIKLSENITRLGLRGRILDTKYFSGFCESGRDLSVVCTMHANCCIGLKAKLHDLTEALQDWTSFQSSGLNSTNVHWRAREKCRHTFNKQGP